MELIYILGCFHPPTNTQTVVGWSGGPYHTRLRIDTAAAVLAYHVIAQPPTRLVWVFPVGTVPSGIPDGSVAVTL